MTTDRPEKPRRMPGDPSKAEMVERMIRVDHAGEYGAVRIYEGQMAVLGETKSGPVIKHMAEQEEVHLATFNDLVADRRVRPTALLPLWHLAGFALGAGTALMGEKAAHACTVAVEEAIDEHYAAQIEALDARIAGLESDLSALGDRLGETLKQLTDAGGQLLAGGKPVAGEGYFFEPTVVRFEGRNEVMCSNELFAPIAAIFSVDGPEAALAFANESDFGLASYVFTRDLSRALTFGERLEFGMVGINRGIMADPKAPFGGTKASGIGREAGQEGIYEFMEQKYMAVTVNEALS